MARPLSPDRRLASTDLECLKVNLAHPSLFYIVFTLFFTLFLHCFYIVFTLFFGPANVSLLIGVTLFVSRPKTAIGLQTQLPWQFSLPQETFVTKLILQNVYFVIAICDHLQNILLPSQFLI